MNYSCNASGAYSQNARNAFNAVYHYTTSDLQFINLNTLRDNLINNKPVYSSGYREKEIIVVQTPIKLIFGMSIGKTKTKTVYSNGHAWVADGYEEIIGTFRDPNKNREYTAMIADHIHMNWGGGEVIMTDGMIMILGKMYMLTALLITPSLYIINK